MTNRKLHMRFRLAPRSTTLDDFEMLLSLNFLGISRDCADLGGYNGWTNEHITILSATELYPTKCTFQRCIDYIDIVRRSSTRAYNQNIVRENGDFQPLYTRWYLANGKEDGHGYH